MAFLVQIAKIAPNLDPDSRSYLHLAVDAAYTIPPAAFALIRVVMEIEVDTLIETLINT